MITEERRHQLPLTEDDVDRIANAVAIKTRQAFYVEEEKHYNDHKKLDNILTAYENATNIFWKAFLGLVITGIILLAGIGTIKGIK